MTKDLIRRDGRGDLHFITVCCYRRLPLLSSARAKNTFVRILDEVRDSCGVPLVGYAVMPEHVHLLIGEPARGTPSTVMQVLKQRVSRRLRRRKKGGWDNWNWASRVEKNCRRVYGNGGFLISTCGV